MADAVLAGGEGVERASHDGLKFWQFMVAGSIVGCTEHVAMFPVDTLKTRLQVPAAGSAISIQQALRSIVKLEGPLGLYRGVVAMILGAGPAHAVYFSVYELCKSRLGGNLSGHHPFAHALSGVAATVASDAVFTPMDVVKQRLQVESSPYRGLADCIRRVMREVGLKGFYASYKTTILMNAPFTAVHFATYEAVKRVLMEISPGSASEERLLVHLTAGAAAGALAGVVTTPLDVVKTRLQCQGVGGCDRFTSSSVGNVIRLIVQKEGYTGLTRGWRPRMLFHGPAAAICWSTYEAAKTSFQEFNQNRKSSP
ncbi:Mitoferrin [Nymphaea thermarum]|nr:Mitoferrin [Nymphaea thermarum]